MEEEVGGEAYIAIAPQPEYAGYYEVGRGGGFRIMLQVKPSWIARTMTRVLLQWYWQETSINQ